MSAAVLENTEHFNLEIPNFNYPGWHTYMNRNLKAIDAALYLLTGVTNIKGIWQQSTTYNVGDRVVDEENDSVWECLIQHNSGTTHSEFDNYRTAEPTHWQQTALFPGTVSGLVEFTNTTDASALTTAAVEFSGGIAVAKKIMVGTALIPDVNDGATLGESALSFSDLFLASGGVINWNAGTLTLTQSSNMLTLAAAGAHFRISSATGDAIYHLLCTAAERAYLRLDRSGVAKFRVGIGLGIGDDFAITNASETVFIRVFQTTGGVNVGAPTGGDKGAGTLNAVGVYDDNTLLTDYVFDKFLDKRNSYSDQVGVLYDNLSSDMFDVSKFSDYWKTYGRMYGMPDLNDCIDGKIKNVSLGGQIQRITQVIELQAIHIDQLNQRLKVLETQ